MSSAFVAPVLRPGGAPSVSESDVLLHPDGPVVVEALGSDHVVTAALTLRMPAGVPFEVKPLTGAAVHRIEVSPDGAAVPSWLGAGPLLRELLEYLARLEPGASRERAEVILADAAEPVRVRELVLATPTDPRFARVAAELRRRPAQSHPVQEWADRSGVGVRTLARLWHADTGLTFSQWRTAARVHVSLYPLALGRPVSSVARQVGHATTGSFVAAFRRVLEASPSDVAD